MRPQATASPLGQLIAQIDFNSEQYYNLFFDSITEPLPDNLTREVWTSLSSLMADFNKLRTELSRMRRGVEELRMPAIEAVGLDRVAEQLRSIETRLRPLTLKSDAASDEGPLKRLLKDLLLVLDTLDRVFEVMAQQPGSVSEGVQAGLTAVYSLLLDTPGRNGLSLVPLEAGSAFDPHEQLAVGTEPHPGLSNGVVSRVLQKGYRLQGQVFRNAQVVVVRNEQR